MFLEKLIPGAGGTLRRKLNKYIKLQEYIFLRGDQYALWVAIDACEKFGVDFPVWIVEELGRASRELLKPSETQNYPAHVANALRLNGNLARTRSARIEKNHIFWKVVHMFEKGLKRSQILSTLFLEVSENERGNERIVDQANRLIKKWSEDDAKNK